MIQGIMMVDRATNCPKIDKAPTKEYETIDKLFDNERLCRYPRPRKVVHDNCNELTGFESQELCSRYGMTAQPTTVQNS